MKNVRVIVLRTAGTNCDRETAFAFELAGAMPEPVHINELVRRERRLSDYQILAIPGGFTYGDDIASGKILANELKFKIIEDIKKFIADGKLIIGICNGFQILVKAGFLPNLSDDFKTIEATLTLNDSAKFEDRWVYLKRVK
ncbi:MAG: phosphoribosylformylglycinamidine synthase subunit PurQ, partial [Candidatus Omnitrophota bacterium]|nr:phosphoribosylformylglycinamidine synthase subunit PurQ [Candidatus Omnitrophota bacterium]